MSKKKHCFRSAPKFLKLMLPKIYTQNYPFSTFLFQYICGLLDYSPCLYGEALTGGRSNTPLSPHSVDPLRVESQPSAYPIGTNTQLPAYLMSTNAQSSVSRSDRLLESTIRYFLKPSYETLGDTHIRLCTAPSYRRSLDVGIDYLMGMLDLSFSDFEAFLRYCSKVFSVTFELIDEPIYHGQYRFEKKLVCPLTGLKLFYKSNLEDLSYTVAFIAPGKSLRPLSSLQVIEFIIRSVLVYKLRYTAIDLKFDDYERRVDATYLWQLAMKGDVAGTKKYLFVSSGTNGDRGFHQADTLYLGSNRNQTRIYNAEVLHDIPAYRWETRFREHKCTTIINYIIDNFNDFDTDIDRQIAKLHQYFANKILNVSKFVKRNGDKKQAISRFERYEFYQSLFDSVGELDKLILKDPPQPKYNTTEFLCRSFDWLNKQVFKRLHLIKSTFGSETFNFLFDICLSSASTRYKKSDFILSDHVKSLMDSLKLDDNQFAQFLNVLCFST